MAEGQPTCESKGMAHGSYFRSITLLIQFRRWHRRLMPFVYILRCTDDSYYVGKTSDLRARLDEHEAGVAANFTARRRPVRMIYAEEYKTLRQAEAREQQLKRWSRKKKAALISGDKSALRRA
jgi:putative endonuclease